MAYSLNGIFRLRLSRNLMAGVSGGISYFNLDGEAGKIGYAKLWLDGLTLHSEIYKLKFKLESNDNRGYNLGAGVDFELNRSYAISLECRYFLCPEVQVVMDVIDNAKGTDSVETIRANLNLKPITADPSFFKVNLGLKYRF